MHLFVLMREWDRTIAHKPTHTHTHREREREEREHTRTHTRVHTHNTTERKKKAKQGQKEREIEETMPGQAKKWVDCKKGRQKFTASSKFSRDEVRGLKPQHFDSHRFLLRLLLVSIRRPRPRPGKKILRHSQTQGTHLCRLAVLSCHSFTHFSCDPANTLEVPPRPSSVAEISSD